MGRPCASGTGGGVFYQVLLLGSISVACALMMSVGDVPDCGCCASGIGRR
jgi:hypothetical protein